MVYLIGEAGCCTNEQLVTHATNLPVTINMQLNYRKAAENHAYRAINKTNFNTK